MVLWFTLTSRQMGHQETWKPPASHATKKLPENTTECYHRSGHAEFCGFDIIRLISLWISLNLFGHIVKMVEGTLPGLLNESQWSNCPTASPLTAELPMPSAKVEKKHCSDQRRLYPH